MGKNAECMDVVTKILRKCWCNIENIQQNLEKCYQNNGEILRNYLENVRWILGDGMNSVFGKCCGMSWKMSEEVFF